MSRVAFLGLGRMGRPMAANLVAAGHAVTVWNRTTAVAQEFVAEHGAALATTPAEAVADAEVVVSMLADDAAVLETWTGDDGAGSALAEGAVAVDMSTIAPRTVATLAAHLDARGVPLLDAPVSGSTPAATAATLTIMTAGDAGALDRARPVLDALGSPVIHVGESGAGASMKLVVNAVLHSLNGALSEAFGLAERAGIARDAAYDVLVESAVAAPYVHYKRAAFEQPDSTPVGFRLDLAAKDVRLALELAAEVGARMPQAEVNLDVLRGAIDAGFGERDESALAVHLRDD